jgi:hypothetical protein
MVKDTKDTKEKEPKRAGKRISDVISDKVNFHNELPKVDFKSLLDTEITIWDAQIITLTNKDFGTRPAALLMVETSTGEKFTTISSGEVIVKKAEQLISNPDWPIIATPTSGKYYNLE